MSAAERAWTAAHFGEIERKVQNRLKRQNKREARTKFFCGADMIRRR
jgi:hypothetical protein